MEESINLPPWFLIGCMTPRDGVENQTNVEMHHYPVGKLSQGRSGILCIGQNSFVRMFPLQERGALHSRRCLCSTFGCTQVVIVSMSASTPEGLESYEVLSKVQRTALWREYSEYSLLSHIDRTSPGGSFICRSSSTIAMQRETNLGLLLPSERQNYEPLDMIQNTV